MQISVVLPCFNEESNILGTVKDIDLWMKQSHVDGDIICVDDGSVDGTAAVLRSLQSSYSRLKIVTHPLNIGYGAAVRSGCDSATTEWIAFMDSDGQFHAEDLSALLPWCDRYDLVVGRRAQRADPFMRILNAKCFGILTWAVLGVWVRDVNCAMKMYKKTLWPVIRPRISTGALFNAELFARAKRAGISWQQVAVHHYPRVRGAQTGARAGVVLRMFRELKALYVSLRNEESR
jgi:glycosyltransferase involved in cell wall biosynthesis